DSKCDVWSIGVITFMLLSGTPPFHGRTDSETLNSVRSGLWHFDEALFKPVSKEGRAFITKCLDRNFTRRPSAAQALEHPWFKLMREEQAGNTQESLNTINSLHTYVRRTSLAKIIRDVVAHSLLPEQIADLRAEFVRFDISHTGDITTEDLKTVLKLFPSFTEDVDALFASIDINETGTISYHEFLAASLSKQHVKEENLQIAFERMSNHNATIIRDDIVLLLGGTSHDVDKIMAEVGLDPTAEINFEDVSGFYFYISIGLRGYIGILVYWYRVVGLWGTG
ncbi:hypothetical protein B484DRAFT_333687, partial [Ochromonadaceae sp. CCMP2298]